MGSPMYCLMKAGPLAMKIVLMSEFFSPSKPCEPLEMWSRKSAGKYFESSLPLIINPIQINHLEMNNLVSFRFNDDSLPDFATSRIS